jgi:metal-responsive CopG/Arc/MetJ family transcriptional regulator
MQASVTTEPKKEGRIMLRCEESFVQRLDRVAFHRFGGNRSEMIRRVLDDLLEREEPEIALDLERRAA